MFGGNPNMRINKPLQPHHIKQQLGTHNNRGLGGIPFGRNAVQSPAQGANVNSTGGVPNPAQHQANLDAGYTVPSGPGAAAKSSGFASIPPALSRDPSLGTYLPETLRPPTDPEQFTYYGRAIGPGRAYGDRIQHFDTLGGDYQSQIRSQRLAAAAARRRAEQMQLLSERDEREAQAARPQSGTTWLYGF